MKVFIETYGCTFNKSDEDIIKGLLLNSNFEVCEHEDAADIVIVNSCSVKRATEQKILHRIMTLRRTKKVLVCGCMPHINERELRLLGVSIVGTKAIHKIKDALFALASGQIGEFFEEGEKSALPRCFSSTIPIARVPIAEGCASNCAFCCTKVARGQIKSYSVEQIVAWIKQALGEGVREIQLTAQDVGAYGLDKGTTLRELFGRIALIDGEFRVRIGMINPTFVRRFPKEIFEYNKFYRFIHLPIQSASNAVLASMRRGYKIENVIDFVNELRSAHDVTFATDVIVGYPTEDENAFRETIRFIEETRPDVTNISKFAPRPKTEAAKLRQLPNAVIKERAVRMSKICRAISCENNKKLIGQIKEILLLENGKNGTIKGRTETYKQTVLPQGSGSKGQFVLAKIVAASPTTLFAQLA